MRPDPGQEILAANHKTRFSIQLKHSVRAQNKRVLDLVLGMKQV